MQPRDGQAGGDDVAVVAQPLGEHAGLRRDDRVLVAVGADRAEPGAAGDLAALVERLGAGEHALGRGDDDAEVGGVLALAVLRAAGDQRAGRVEVVRRLDREQLDAGQLALGDAGQRAGRAPARWRR